jgi:hypothetical protein
MSQDARATLAMVDRLMLEVIEQQERKVLEHARRIHPGLTAEDIRNPQDFPDLIASPQWNFEDGILAGLRSAHMALRAKLLEEGEEASGS